MSAKPLLLYLHGFLSSPQSKKAQQTLAYCAQIGLADSIEIPELDAGPAEAIKQLRKIILSHENRSIMLIGSSLGGYYASYLAEQYGFPAALINPAVRPFERWESHLGEHRNYYSDKIHLVTPEHIEELKLLDSPRLTRLRNILLLVQTGDETLDHRLALDKFASSPTILRQGGNHSYENFDQELPAIFEFLLSRI